MPIISRLSVILSKGKRQTTAGPFCQNKKYKVTTKLANNDLSLSFSQRKKIERANFCSSLSKRECHQKPTSNGIFVIPTPSRCIIDRSPLTSLLVCHLPSAFLPLLCSAFAQSFVWQHFYLINDR